MSLMDEVKEAEWNKRQEELHKQVEGNYTDKPYNPMIHQTVSERPSYPNKEYNNMEVIIEPTERICPDCSMVLYRMRATEGFFYEHGTDKRNPYSPKRICKNNGKYYYELFQLRKSD